MKQRVFEAQNADRWASYESLVGECERLGRGKPDLEAQVQLSEFPRRYREICRDLAVATEREYSPRLIDRLNRMTVDGHRALYTRDPDLLRRILRFVSADFPRRLRADWIPVTLATLIFVLPGIAIWLLINHSPELIYSVMDGEQVRSFESMYDSKADHIGSDRTSGDDVGMFGFYIFNNISIAFRAFAGGLFAGIGSVLVLFFNGILLGAVSAHIGQLGFERTFYSFVVGHGAFELTAIVISGAAGMKLGWSIIAPGPNARRAALLAAAREAIVLVYGVLGMLVIAAVLEAFWSSKGSIEPEIKFAVGGVFWAFVLLYFCFAGRTRTRSVGGRAGGVADDVR